MPSCAVALAAKSPVFHVSPRPRLAPVFCPSPLSPSPSPKPSPLSPFTSFRLQKQASSFRNYISDRYEPVVLSSSSPSTTTATTETLLKRKRPARIEVPVVSPLGLEHLDCGNRSVGKDEMEDEGEGYAVYCKRGKKRGDMEDRHSAVVGLQGNSKKAIFSVFDGHGGAKAADFAAKNLNVNIINELPQRNEGGSIEEAMEKGYLTTDAHCMNEDISGGTCCVTALIQDGNLAVSNAGDCRAVISRGGIAEALTVDHRPSRQDERERVEALGGYVDCCHGVWRIQGSLAVSRGIGDLHLKQWVISKPDTKTVQIGPGCEFLILASDGLWDKVDNQEAVDAVRSPCVDADKVDLCAACRRLVKLSLERGCTDDVSVMLIQLSRFIQSV